MRAITPGTILAGAICNGRIHACAGCSCWCLPADARRGLRTARSAIRTRAGRGTGRGHGRRRGRATGRSAGPHTGGVGQTVPLSASRTSPTAAGTDHPAVRDSGRGSSLACPHGGRWCDHTHRVDKVIGVREFQARPSGDLREVVPRGLCSAAIGGDSPSPAPCRWSAPRRASMSPGPPSTASCSSAPATGPAPAPSCCCRASTGPAQRSADWRVSPASTQARQALAARRPSRRRAARARCHPAYRPRRASLVEGSRPVMPVAAVILATWAAAGEISAAVPLAARHRSREAPHSLTAAAP